MESVESVESVESMESVEMQRHLVPILNPFLDQLVAMDPDLPGSHDLLCGGDQEGKLGELLELGDTVVRPSILL